jgi:hypothetical protein
MTVSNENYARQHTVDDTIEGVDFSYLWRAARINAAALATLALAPSAPAIAPVLNQAITRGPSGYDANLKWTASEGSVAGYVIVMRKTTSPDWEREIYVGNVTEHVLKDVSIDEWVFGIRAIGQNGTESLTSAYVNPPRAKAAFKTVP